MIKKFIQYIKEELTPNTYRTVASDLEEYGHPRERGDRLRVHADDMEIRMEDKKIRSLIQTSVDNYTNHYSDLEPFTMRLGDNDFDHRHGEMNDDGIYEVYLCGFHVYADYQEDPVNDIGQHRSLIISPRFLVSTKGDGVFDDELDSSYTMRIMIEKEAMEDPNGFNQDGEHKYYYVQVFNPELDKDYAKFTTRKDAMRFKQILMNEKQIKKKIKGEIPDLVSEFDHPIVRFKRVLQAVRINLLWNPKRGEVENKGPKPK